MSDATAKDQVPPYRYAFSEADAAAIADEIGELLRSGGHLTMGSHGDALERDLTARYGRGSSVAVSNGTGALEIALRALGVGDGEVLVPTNTFGATVVSVLRVGATPVFVDCAEDMSASAKVVAARLSAQTQAVMVVHIGGHIAGDTPDIRALCQEAGVPLIEDAAHALGSELNGRAAGSFGVAAAFSLFSTKVITSGEGGLLYTRDLALATKAKLLRNHAKMPDGTMEEIGYNWRLSEFQAVVARRQLAALDDVVRGRARVAELYDARLRGIEGTEPLRVSDGGRPNWYKYIVVVDAVRPDLLVTRMRERHGVVLGGWVYRTPCHEQKAFKVYADGRYPNAERLCRSHVCLPIYPDMTEDEVDLVADAFRTEVAAIRGTA